ncbi:hypothetical protein Tco_0164271 [Tanacetum coccineum]
MSKKLVAEEVRNIPWTVPKKFHCAKDGFVRPKIALKAIRRKRMDFGRRIAQFYSTYGNVVRRSESGANDEVEIPLFKKNRAKITSKQSKTSKSTLFNISESTQSGFNLNNAVDEDEDEEEV